MKNLKIAQIVPVDCLVETEFNQYHMCLAHLVGGSNKPSEVYTKFYRRMSDEGKYVLMDNGAAENSQLDFNSLISMYKLINPTEIVLPDVLCNKDETIERTCDFYSQFKDQISDYKLMVVPQGNSFEEWCMCAYELLQRVPVTTIGVSKFLEMATEDRTIRTRACEFLRPYDVEIHLLGCSEGPIAVREARRANNKVRGCDSAFTYICAKADVRSIGSQSTRPEGEIDFLHDPAIMSLGRLMGEFELTAGVIDNRVDSTWR